MGPELLVPLALGSAGLNTAGGIMKASGESAAMQYKATQAARIEYAAKTAADQTDAALREQLATTLGNIAAIRASSGVASDSPTGLAIAAKETEVSDRQRRIRVGNLESQAAQSAADAEYFRNAADSVLGTGIVGAFASGIDKLAYYGKAA
jgi:hypothetical protein